MTAVGTIGVLGATGRVGAAAARFLATAGHPLRLGARRRGLLDALAATLGPRIETYPVDLDDDRGLAAFVRDCTVVLHCAAPAFGIGERVATAAATADVHYVDVGGDALLHQRLGAAVPGGWIAVLGAGAIPGLSALLPRWLCTRFGPLERLTGYAGGLERCSPGVAQDIRLSLQTGSADGAAYGEPLAAWRAGRRVSRALRAVEDGTAPFFDGPVALQPFLAAETERLGAALGVGEIDWFNVHPGPAVRAVLLRLHSLAPDRADVDLIRAAELDLAGRDPYHLMVFQADTAPGEHTAVLRSPDSYALTGFVGAHAATAVAACQIRPGLHYACDVLDADVVLSAIGAAGVSRLELVDHDGSDIEEGIL